jgi:predicted RNase H-like HicB family nuclease
MTHARYNVFLEWDADEQLWVATIPSLNWLSTYGVTRSEALEQAREAALGYVEAAATEGLEVPRSDGEAELAAVEVAAP